MDVKEKMDGGLTMRPIDADVVFAKLNKICVTDDVYGMGVAEGIAKAMSAILSTSTIEAEPVRHGRWVIEKRHTVSRNPYIDDNYFASATCSECDFCIHAETKSFGYPDLNTTNYCPNCGAKMDKGE